jgi:hypothetical protein
LDAKLTRASGNPTLGESVDFRDLSGLTNGRSYRVMVEAINSAGTTLSPIIFATPEASQPGL